MVSARVSGRVGRIFRMSTPEEFKAVLPAILEDRQRLIDEDNAVPSSKMKVEKVLENVISMRTNIEKNKIYLKNQWQMNVNSVCSEAESETSTPTRKELS